MLIEILKHTPLWVFVLFLALLVYGYSQSKNRTVSPRRIAFLPVVMISLSFYGVLSAFYLSFIALALWGVGLGVSILVGKLLLAPPGVNYSNETRSFYIPGSWLPLILMLVVFFIKYAVGVVLARQLAVGNTALFIGSVSFLYGFFSGLFLSRALVVWRSKKRTASKISGSQLNRAHADDASAG